MMLARILLDMDGPSTSLSLSVCVWLSVAWCSLSLKKREEFRWPGDLPSMPLREKLAINQCVVRKPS